MRESGSVSILMAAMLAVLLVFVPAVLDLGSFTMARAKAHNAADAAALAAAQELVGGGDPASAASEYAVKNDATVAGLIIGSDSVIVTAAVESPRYYVSRIGISPGRVIGRGKAELKDVRDLDY